jgi:hypothetical protein
MKWEQQQALHAKLVEQERDLLNRKGAEYASDDDALDNFKRGAREIGIDPKQILWIYMSKHLSSIKSFIRKGKVLSDEPIAGRIADARNYLFLLQCLIDEDERTKDVSGS